MSGNRRPYDPQFDLFVPYVADAGLRDQREAMERPFFSLSKRKRLKPIEYVSPDGEIFVTVSANQKFGMATIWDADVLIWAASTLHDMKRKGVNDLPRTLNFHAYELLKTIHRQVSGSRYEELRGALRRLQSTTIETNIRVPKGKKHRQFAWLDSWSELVNPETGETKGMSLTLSDWFYEGITMDGGVLSIDPEYFSISGGRERWLYRVVRKHAGGAGSKGFSISMPTLFEKSGAEGTYRRFKFEIAKIVEANDLPSYDLKLLDTKPQPSVLMMRRDAPQPVVSKPASQPRKRPQRSIDAQQDLTLPLVRTLSDETLANFRRQCAGWDVYAVKSEFDEWISGADEREPKNYQAAFIGFAKRWAARQPK